MWIEEYRKAYGLELDDLARRVNVAGRKMEPRLCCTVTDTLIYVLERSKTPRTHPRIADAIAIACKATAEQRDSIVDEKHRGTFDPQQYNYTVSDAKVEKPVRQHKPGYEHSVVKVSKSGKVISRYKSLAEAERYGDMSIDTIRRRCRRMGDEFAKFDYTYRWAEEWDLMNRIQRLRDLGVEIS